MRIDEALRERGRINYEEEDLALKNFLVFKDLFVHH